MLVTTDGELLGTSYPIPEEFKDIAELSTLVTEITADYQRLGQELILLDGHTTTATTTTTSDEQASTTNTNDSTSAEETGSHSTLFFVELELAKALIGVASTNVDCLVIAIADPKTPSGLLKGRLEALAHHVQEALTPLTEPT
jgi:hypothetical protein